MPRTTEAEIAEAVLVILADSPSGEASMAELKDRIPQHIDLSSEDRTQSTTRPNDELWEQQVRNITSHKNVEGNIIHDGYAESIPGGIRITAAGRLKIANLFSRHT